MTRAAALLLFAALGCGGASETVETATAEPPKREAIDAGPAMMGEEEPVGESRDVHFATEDGVVIQGQFRPGPTRREGDDQGDHVVLLVHQLGSDQSEWAGYIPSLTAEHSVLTIDLRGHGDSLYRSDGSSIDRESFGDEDWARTVLDVRAAVAYLGDLQPRPRAITLVGSSIGSSAVLLYAADDPDVTSVVALSPGLSYRAMKTEPALRALEGRPVLLIANEGDRASARSARRLARRSRSATARVFAGRGHGVTMTGPVLPTLLEFLRGRGGAKPGPGE